MPTFLRCELRDDAHELTSRLLQEASSASPRRIKNCTKLELLCLSDSGIESDEFKELGRLSHLKHINLSRTQITGKGLAELQRLTLMDDSVVSYLDLMSSKFDSLTRAF